jgi:hypothetical protein
MTFQESDCVFTAFDQRSISNDHSASLKEKELRKGVAMPSNATLLFDASTSESTTVTTSSYTSAFRNFAIISSHHDGGGGAVPARADGVAARAQKGLSPRISDTAPLSPLDEDDREPYSLAWGI